MCGRLALSVGIDVLIQAFGILPGATLIPRYNIAPTQPLAAVCEDAGGERRLQHLRWGLIPAWAKDPAIGSRMINARCETVATKPAFRHALRQRRCLIPADGFYEWQQGATGKTPHFIRRRDRAPLAFAGIWERWDGEGGPIDSCAILTSAATPQLAPIHERMPVILTADAYAPWLDRDLTDPARLLPWCHSSPDLDLEAYPVSTLVNKVQNDGPECVAPLERG